MAILDTIKSQLTGGDDATATTSAASAKAGKSIRVKCPCGGCDLVFFENEKTVKCDLCGDVHSTASLLSRMGISAPANAPAETDAVVAAIDSPESGLIYLENFFANYDWENYGKNVGVVIPAINSMVEKNKIRQGALADSWLLDFKSVATPLRKKLEGLTALDGEMAELYNGKDSANVLSYFDRYKAIVANLIDTREKLLKRLENDLAYAEKQGLAKDKLAEMAEEYKALAADVNALVEVKELLDLRQVAAKQAEIDKKMIAEFKAKGLDVVGEYKNACLYYNQATNDKRAALSIFESIRGYADSVSYIDKINRYFSYYGKFYNFFGTNFVFKSHVNEVAPVNPNAKDEKSGCLKKKPKSPSLSEEETYTGKTLELYEVVDNEPAEEPILKSITQIITYYGSKLFYIKLGKIVCSFDLGTKQTTELFSVKKASDLKLFASSNSNSVYYNENATSIFFRVRLDLVIDKPGCVKSLLGKKQTIRQRRNNYAVYELNLAKDTCTEVIDQVVDIIDRRGEYLFYTFTEELQKGEVETDETKKELKKLSIMAMNTTTYEKETIFKEDCDIKAIEDSKIIYTVCAPNRYNLDLHVFDIETKQDTVIEKNIRSFLTVTEGKIFYYIGNKDFSPLFSNNLEGTDRVEIMTNIESVVAVAAGWIYVVKGSTRNALLIKVSTDGKQRIVVCSQFNSSVKITDSYIYYVDVFNSLRVVRSDGCENTLIAEDIDLDNVVVDKDCIYYLRRERTGAKIGASLYCMDIDGHNVRKLLFNVVSMANYDDDTLYVERDDQIRYHILFPAKHKKEEKEEEKTFNLVRYYKFNKKSGELDNMLTIGLPHAKKYQLKGCFGKKTDVEPIFTEIPIEVDFEEQGERAGASMNEQLAEKRVEEAAAAQQKAALQNNKSNNQGCNGCLGKK